MATENGRADYVEAEKAAQGAGALVVDEPGAAGGRDSQAPLAVVPAGVVLRPAELAALSRMMEYSRKGQMRPPVNCTRQVWIEDFLTRGFTQLETIKFGRAPERVRITNPGLIVRGRPAFYEVQSAIEIAYVRTRHMALHGERLTVDAESTPVPELQRGALPAPNPPQGVERDGGSRRPKTPAEALGEAAASEAPAARKAVGWAYPSSENATKFGFAKVGCWTLSIERPGAASEAISGYATKSEALEAAFERSEDWSVFQAENSVTEKAAKAKKAAGFADSYKAEASKVLVTAEGEDLREMSEVETREAEALIGRVTAGVPAGEQAGPARQARGFMGKIPALLNGVVGGDALSLGAFFSIMEQYGAEPYADALWDRYQREVLKRITVAARRPRPEGRALREAVRTVIGEHAWARFLRARSQRVEAGEKQQGTAAASAPAAAVDPNAVDFSYGRGETITPAGAKTRIRANIAAIKLVKQIEAEKRQATREEKRVLAAFNGWGQHKGLFEDNGHEIDALQRAHGPSWEAAVRAEMRNHKARYSWPYHNERLMNWWDEYGTMQRELKALMTDQEWNKASASILNAHYTSEEICHWMWDVARQAGFEGGKVLEPAVGASGRILGAMPADLKAVSRTEAVEIDPLAARIAAALYPQTKVHACGFEEAVIAPGSFDLVISNVPFGKTGPGVQDSEVQYNLHNFFIAESMKKLKPGGIAVIITSHYTLEAADDQREALGALTELHGAVRLPSDAFKGNAGTEVVTDVLVLRRPDGRMQAAAESFAQLTAVKVAEGEEFTSSAGKVVDTSLINEYFGRHPELVLGMHSMKGSLYGKSESGQYTVVSPKDAGPIETRLAGVMQHMPQGIASSASGAGARKMAVDVAADEVLMATIEERPGMLVNRGGREFYVVQPNRELIRPAWQLSEDLPKGFRTLKDVESMAENFLRLRGALEAVVALDLNPITSDAASAEARAGLLKEYKAFVKAYGSINAAAKQLRAIAPQDSTMGSVFALERVQERPAVAGRRREYEITPAQILTRRTLFPPTAVGKAATIEQGVVGSLNQLGTVDPAYVAGLLGRDDVASVIEEILKAGLAFRDHEDPENLVQRSLYLSGDVISKARAAKKAAIADPRLEASAAALEAVRPEEKPFERIKPQFGGTWIPGHVYASFVEAAVGVGVKPPYYDQRGGQWFWPGVRDGAMDSRKADSRIGTRDLSWNEVLMDALNQTPRKMMRSIDKDTKVFDPEATAAVRARVEAINEAWVKWLAVREDMKAELVTEFNRRFNRVVRSSVKGDHLTFPGLATGPGALVPRFYQRDAVARFLEKPAGVVAHGTGYGKTLTGILIAHEAKRLGQARKPLIVCDSANYAQFVAAHRAAYPQDRILVADDANFSPQERENFKAQACYGDYDCILMSRTQFGKIPVSNKTLEAWANNEIADLRYALVMASAAEDKKSQRKIEVAIAKATAKLAEFKDKQKTEADAGLTWEELGIDLVIVDECHRHKKTGFPSAFGHIKGVDTGVSTRGRDLLMKVRFIQDRRKGMGAIGLSGTPCTNTMAEFWNMNRLFDPNALRDFSVEYFDQFKTAFCLTESRLEMNEANGRYRYVERMCRFMNATVLAQFVRTGADLQLDPTKLNLTLPKHESGEIEFAIVPITDAVLDQMERLARIYEEYESLGGMDKREKSWVPLTLMGMGMAASIDPRLIDPDSPDDPESLVNKCVRNVVEIGRATAAERKTQVIFADRFRTMDTSVLADFENKGVKKTAIVLDESEERESADPDDLDGGEKGAASDEVTIGVQFNLYRDIKEKLIASGEFTAGEIAIIGDAKNADERMAIFEKVKAGIIRVVMGSSDKLGIGANFQDRLYASHNFDPPRNMTPDQQEQRDGRIVRSGNRNSTVRVILYGMQDTCTVAIWNRIQTKRRFIRQGLLGDADELEDVGDVRLDEFKAALVADKRQLKIADLNGRIRDEKMALDVADQREQDLAGRIRNLESSIRVYGDKDVPDIERSLEFLSENVPAFSEKVVVDMTDLAKNCPTLEVATWFAERAKENKPLVVEGPMEDLEKELRPLVEAMKGAKLEHGHDQMQLGAVTINNLRVRLSYARVMYRTSGREAEALLMGIANPLSANDPFVSLTQFGTADLLLRTTAAVPTRLRERLVGLKARVEEYQKDKAAVEVEHASLAKPDLTRLKALEEELGAVQKDMLDHPYVRGSERAKKRAPELIEAPEAASGKKVAGSRV